MNTTDEKYDAQVAVDPQLLDNTRDLLGKLSSRGQHQRLCRDSLRIDLINQRGTESERLSRPGLGFSHNVTPCEDRTDAQLLDRCRVLDSHILNASQDVLSDIKIGELLLRFFAHTYLTDFLFW